jgi:hypothetical protein
MIGLVAWLVVVPAQSSTFVPDLGIVDPVTFNFVSDSNDQNPFDTAQSFIDETERMHLLEQACTIWSRTGGVSRYCRAFELSDLTPASCTEDDGQSVFHVCDRAGLTAGQEALAAATCHTSVFSDECDIFMDFDNSQNANWNWRSWASNVAADQCRGGSTCGPNTVDMRDNLPGTSLPGRLGFDAENVWQSTLLHEVGHTLGLDHTLTFTPPSSVTSCDPSAYDCPVMSQTASRVSRWPQWDEIIAMREYNGEEVRHVDYALWNVSAAGTLSAGPWQSLPSVFTGLAPHVSCSPSSDSTRNCVVTNVYIDGPTEDWRTPQFHILTVTSTGVTRNQQLSTTLKSESPVDIAYGNNDIFVAVGKRPVDLTDPAQLTMWVGNANTGTLVGEVMDFANCGRSDDPDDNTPADEAVVDLATHTEPRISYSESTGFYVVASADLDGWVRVTVWGFDGAGFLDCLDQGYLDAVTILPPQVTCDNHLPGASYTCSVFVQPLSSRVGLVSGGIKTFQFTVPITGDLNDSATVVNGIPRDLVSASTTQSVRRVALMGDVATYGNGVNTAQLQGSAWLFSGDRFRHEGVSRARLIFDNSPLLDGSNLDFTFAATVDQQSNTFAVDWCESAQRFIFVRPGVE